MARSPPPKTQPDSSRITRLRIASAIYATALLAVIAAPGILRAQASPACTEWGAELSAIEGVVEIKRGEDGRWSRITKDEVLCFGDSVRAQAFSRVVVRLPDQSVFRVDERSTLTLLRPDDGIGSLIELIRGVIHVISRDPRSLRFTTPYANAGLEGTEFDIRVAESEKRTEVTVLEGEVVVTTPMGRVDVPSGFAASAREGEMPEARPVLAPIELMRWASYFPEIFDTELPAPDEQPPAERGADAGFYAARAAARLRRGNLESAEEDIATSLRLAPGNPDALALRAIVAIGHSDPKVAREHAAAASSASDPTPAAFIARSYVEQAEGNLQAALATVEAALSLDPDNAIAWARRAEIELGQNRWNESLASAQRAIDLRGDLGYARTVLGFVRLGGGDIAAALEAFEQAAARDRSAPLPHIGLALALIQRGDLVLGRQELELAVALDPTNALSRSYMAKTYDAERRAKLPASQLELAKRFDPNDPTAWLYDALLKVNRNRPVEALDDLLGAISRNDNRALFRSRLAMDPDLATRSAGTGRVLRELGFEELALVRGWAATAAVPTDYAAHRLLADVYSARPRDEIARVSELWTSQLLQPANVTPIQPQLGQGSLLLVNRAAPSELAFSGLTPLVTTNGLRFQASTVVGANDTLGEDIAVAGLRDRVSYSVGQFHYSTDGFRENNDFEQTITNAFLQLRPNERTSVVAEVRSSDLDRGDISRFFAPARYNTDLRFREDADTVRLGARRDLSPHDTLLVSLSRIDSRQAIDLASGGIDSHADSRINDFQLVHESERWNLRGGAFFGTQDAAEVDRLGASANRDEVDQRSLYAYTDIKLGNRVMLTTGVAADEVDGLYVDKRKLNPKIGLTWAPNERLTVRSAAFRTLQANFSTSKLNPQPRLEPLQVAGFNQFPFGNNADEALVNGVAIDAKLSDDVFAGVDLETRDVDGSFVVYLSGSTPFVAPTDSTEKAFRSYLYWTPRQDVSFSAQYQRERLAGDAFSFPGFVRVRTQRLPLEARYFNPNGFSIGLKASRYRQEGEFLAFNPAAPETTEHGADRFWIVDASIGYRLPNRRGVLSFNVDNLLDEEFRFQDIDPENPSIMPERMAYFRFTLSFD